MLLRLLPTSASVLQIPRRADRKASSVRTSLNSIPDLFVWLPRMERAVLDCQIYLFFFAINFLQDYTASPVILPLPPTKNISKTIILVLPIFILFMAYSFGLKKQ